MLVICSNARLIWNPSFNKLWSKNLQEKGNNQKSATSIVSEVPSNFSPSSKFLHRVGLTPSKQRSSSLHDARVQELEDQLQLEREQSADLVHQMEELRKKQRASFDAYWALGLVRWLLDFTLATLFILWLNLYMANSCLIYFCGLPCNLPYVCEVQVH